MNEWHLRNVWQNRQPVRGPAPLSEAMERLDRRLGRRVRQIGALAAAWDACVPEALRDRASLVTYTRGVLTVALDSAPHRFQLEMLLRNGLLEALRGAFRGGALDRVRVVPGPYDYLELPDRRLQA